MGKEKAVRARVHREPLTSDVIFKAVFGQETQESKSALIELLNLVLELEDDPITDITYKNPFSVAEAETQKYIIMDILVETGNGEKIDIEMQVGNLNGFRNRSLYYICDLVTKSLDKGKDYGKMKKSIMISFIKGSLFPDEENFHSTYELRNRETGALLTDRVELHYIELEKIPWDKKLVDDLTPLEQMGAYMMLTGEDEHVDFLETLVKKGKGVISMTDKVLKKVSEEERIQALRFSREMWELQEAMGRVEAHEEGRIEGKTEGLIEGDRKRQLESARIMKADNMPTDLIKKYTGLSENEIEKL